MAWRFQSHQRFTVGSGMAQWVNDQMQQRLSMAFHLRQGEDGEELSHVTTDIVTTGPTSERRENVTIDVFWPDDREDLAVDTRNTIFDASVTAHLRSDTDEDSSWGTYHVCRHDLTVPEPCPRPLWEWPT